ncbi:hypothetical protein BKA69DRAFT_852998 [Paraphysoderma sedebokerense]|nr:hypothetical protein BKA69DRAFT_852998 [Paraphysoderma sedebokerense]
MTLLDSMSPYLKDDERPIGNAPKSAPLPQSGTSKAAVRLEKVLHEISDNLARLRNEASSFSNTPGTYTPRLQEHQEQIDTTLGLVNVISSVHPHNPRFSQILDRLEKVALISQPVVVNDPAPKETPKRLSIIQTSIEDTYDELNEIVSLLTEEPIMITSSKSRNRPSTPVKSSSHSSQSSQDRLIIQTERSQSTRAESPPKDSAFVSSGSESIRLKSRAPIDNTGVKSRSRRSISSPNLAEANS